MPRLTQVTPAPFRNLWTLDESLYTNGPVQFVAVQGINGTGRIKAHDHGRPENLTELIFLHPGSMYRGLERYGVVIEGYSRGVPIGVRHGDARMDSSGQWVSVKVDDSATYLENPVALDDLTVAHTFDYEGDLLVVAASDDLSKLERVMERARGDRNIMEQVIMGLPLIDSYEAGGEYTKVDSGSDVGRYLTIAFTS